MADDESRSFYRRPRIRLKRKTGETGPSAATRRRQHGSASGAEHAPCGYAFLPDPENRTETPGANHVRGGHVDLGGGLHHHTRDHAGLIVTPDGGKPYFLSFVFNFARGAVVRDGSPRPTVGKDGAQEFFYIPRGGDGSDLVR